MRSSSKVIQIFLCTLITASTAQAAFRIFLDPGHGGRDNGVVQKGTREADIVLDFANELKTQIAQNQTYEIILSREGNETLSLAARVAKAHEAKAQLFLSFHVNSTPDAKAQGIEVFFRHAQKPEEPRDEVARTRSDLLEMGALHQNLRFSRLFAQSIQNNKDTFSRTRVLLKQAPFYVISKTEIPAVLIELGFLTHPRERQKLLQKAYREEIASEIINALDIFISSSENSRNKYDDKGSVQSLD